MIYLSVWLMFQIFVEILVLAAYHIFFSLFVKPVWHFSSLFYTCCFWVFKGGKQERWLFACQVADLSGNTKGGFVTDFMSVFWTMVP